MTSSVKEERWTEVEKMDETILKLLEEVTHIKWMVALTYPLIVVEAWIIQILIKESK